MFEGAMRRTHRPRGLLLVFALLGCATNAPQPTPVDERLDGVTSLRCGELRATWDEERWLFRRGAVLLHSSEPTDLSVAGPFSPDCRRVALLERELHRLAIYATPAAHQRWPAPSVTIALPVERARACEVAGLRWRSPERLSFIVGCDGWHGLVSVLVDLSRPEQWLLDGPEMCRITARFSGASADACEERPLEPFDWKR